MITIVAKPQMAHQVAHANAMAEGLRRHNQTVCITAPGKMHQGTVICWGWEVGEFYHNMGCQVLVMERGYIGDRNRWTSLGWNGLNGNAVHPECKYFHPTRFKQFEHLLKPFKTGGEYALIIGQVSGDMSLRGVNIWDWYDLMVREAARLPYPIMFRPHPVSIEYGERTTINGATTLKGGLSDALEKAAVVITFNSNAATDSVLAGRPTIAMNRGSIMWPIVGHDLVIPLHASSFTLPYLECVSWCQWTIEEIASGDAWEHVKDGVN